MEKIFCLGFSKTGTTSLEKSLEILGYNVCRGHWKNPHTFYLLALYIHKDYKEIFRIVNYWDAFADAPWGGTDLYMEIQKRIPQAKYILTVRDEEEWFESFRKLITMFDLNDKTALQTYHAKGMYGSAYFFESIFSISSLFGNKDKIISIYKDYNNKVRKFLENKKLDHIIIDLTKGDGWDKVCPFLDKPVPKEIFPHANQSSNNPYLSNKKGLGIKKMIKSAINRI